MIALDFDALCAQLRGGDYPRGTPDEVALWQEDLEEARANLAIEDMNLSDEDQALFAMMLEEGLSPTAMVQVLQTLYRAPDNDP